MNSPRQLFTFIAAAFIATVFASPASAALIVRVDVDTHVDPPPGQTNAPPDSHQSIALTLGDRYLIEKTDTSTVVIDFATRKRNVIDNAAGSRIEYSLFDTVGFRTYELRNREMLGKTLAAAKVDKPPMTQIDNENNLSVQTAASSPLQVTVDSDEQTFSDAGAPLFRRSLQGTPVTAAQARMFAQFLRYSFGGHPQILASVAGSTSIPQRFTMTLRNVGVSTRQFTVRSVESNDGLQMIDLHAIPLRLEAAAPNAVERVLDRAAAIRPQDLQAARQQNKDDMDAALAEGRMVDAFLCIFEWTLMTAEPPPVFTPEQQARFRADPIIPKIAAAIPAKTKEALTESIKVFAEARSAAHSKAYVLDIFEANDRAMLGERQAAIRLFIDVLDHNPEIAGVYKDLGDNLFADFDMPLAWRSWDAGRAIAPRFANFAFVNEFERTLLAEHPEFF